MKAYDIFKKVTSEYEGKYIERFGREFFTSNNEICCYYNNGKIHTKKVVPCFIGITERNSIDVWEETHEILGGALTSFSEELLTYYLEKYNFKKKKKKNEQLNLFDLIGG